MLRLDPPEHTRLRKLVTKAFTARRVEALRPRVQQITGHLVAKILPLGQADLMRDFALPLPVTVISELLGVPEDGRQEFLYWSNLYAGLSDGDVSRREQARDHMQDYLAKLIDAKSRHPAGGPQEGSLLDELITIRSEGERLSRDELLSMAFLLMIAGYETTASLIGNGMLALLHHPSQLAALRADPARIGAAIEELLRYDGPFKIAPMLRFTTADVCVADTVIPAGETLALFLAAANHDPLRFTVPAALDVSRDALGHVGFGHGVHYCLGAPLARIEAESAFTALLTRFSNLALGPGGPVWRHSFQLHSLRNLPVTFTPGPEPRTSAGEAT